MVLKCEINKIVVNTLIDTGAGKSLMDIATVRRLNLIKEIKKSDDCRLYDASNNKMDIICTVSANVELVNSKKSIRHDFHVLNKETYSTILLGRDFMRKVGEISFDVRNNSVKVNNIWLKGVQIKSKESVRLAGEIEIPARSECVITGKCNNRVALMVADFEPSKVKGLNGVYISKAKVKPKKAMAKTQTKAKAPSHTPTGRRFRLGL